MLYSFFSPNTIFTIIFHFLHFQKSKIIFKKFRFLHILSVFLIKNGEMRQCDEVDTQRSTQHYLTFIILLQNNIRMEEMSVKKPTGIHFLFSSKLKHFWREKSSVCKELKKKKNYILLYFCSKLLKR